MSYGNCLHQINNTLTSPVRGHQSLINKATRLNHSGSVHSIGGLGPIVQVSFPKGITAAFMNIHTQNYVTIIHVYNYSSMYEEGYQHNVYPVMTIKVELCSHYLHMYYCGKTMHTVV